MKFLWQKLRMHSLQQKIVLSQILFMILPMIVGFAAIYSILCTRYASDTQIEIQNAAAAIAKNIDREMTSYVSRSGVFVYNGELLELLNGANARDIISIIKLRSLIRFFTFGQTSIAQRLPVYTFYLEDAYEDGGYDIASLHKFPNDEIKNQILASDFNVIWWEDTLIEDKYGNKYISFYRNIPSITKGGCILQVTFSTVVIDDFMQTGVLLELDAVFYLISSKEELITGYRNDGAEAMEIDVRHYLLQNSAPLLNGSFLMSGLSRSEINKYKLKIGLALMLSLSVLVMIIFLLSQNTTRAITKGLNGFINQIADLREDEMKQYISRHTFEDEIAVITKKLMQILINHEETYRQLAESDKKRSILEAFLLQERFNPHLLYNSLTVMRIHSIRNKDMKTVKLLDSLTAYYRSALAKGDVLESIENELTMLMEYISIVNQITDSHYQVAPSVQENLFGRSILRHMLQPLAENAIKHGFTGRDDGRISIDIHMEGDKITIDFSDDGVGMDQSRIDDILLMQNADTKGGYGLRNLIQRLKAYYNDAYIIHISSEIDKGTSILLLIPVKIQ